MNRPSKSKKANSKDYQVAYICNGKNPACKDKYGCFYAKPVNGVKGSCTHTLDPKYAKYGTCKGHPCHHPDRFDRFTCGDQIRYYEKYRQNP